LGVDIFDFLCSLFIFLLFLLFLDGLSLPFSEDGIDCKIDFPEDALDECGNDIDNDDVHEAKIGHDIAIVLRVAPAVVKGDHRPPSLGQYLDHNVMGLNESSEGGELLVLVIVRRAFGCVAVVEELHADD
jgi:hypothetical protein